MYVIYTICDIFGVLKLFSVLITDKTNIQNEIPSAEVGFSKERVKQDAPKIQFQVKINGVDIERSKDIVYMKTFSNVKF